MHSPSLKEQKGAGGGQGSLGLPPTGSSQLPQVAQQSQHLAFVLGGSALFERKAVRRLGCFSALGSSGAGSYVAMEGPGCWLAGHEVMGGCLGWDTVLKLCLSPTASSSVRLWPSMGSSWRLSSVTWLRYGRTRAALPILRWLQRHSGDGQPGMCQCCEWWLSGEFEHCCGSWSRWAGGLCSGPCPHWRVGWRTHIRQMS